MNYTLQLHGERLLYPVPSGLYELMSDIAREVLRDQPSMLYQYIAHYIDTLVRVREYSRDAVQLINDVTQENVELLSFVDMLGVPYELADLAARKIQQAFRVYRAKHNIRRAVQDELSKRSLTESIQEWLRARVLDLETAERASRVIQRAFREYRSKKLSGLQKLSKDASTHTIESIPLKSPVRKSSLPAHKKPLKRDSKLLVYQQSPKHSILSTWSTLARDFAEKEKRSLKETKEPELVFEQASTSYTSFKDEVPELVATEERMASLPSYYDETQPKIPMISESGLLVSDEAQDIVTLFSTDSVGENQHVLRGSDVSFPSLLNFTPTSKPEDLAKELFDIIGNTTAATSKLQTLKSLSGSSNDSARTAKELSVLAKESSLGSVRRTASTDQRL